MSFANFYIEKYTKQQILIPQLPHPQVRLVVTIPAFNEPKLTNTLQSLYECSAPGFKVEVIVLINCPEDATEAIKTYNYKSYTEALAFATGNNNGYMQIFPLYVELPVKDAGVGLARKLAMDEAVRRFNVHNISDGIITGFDADCLCDPNYFTAIERAFSDKKINGASIYFEHPITGTNEPEACYQAIQLYELYLRYYTEALRFAKFPFAYHTIGSAFAVKASAYIAQGGMNKRKAGEDFYFLQKIISLGYYAEINDTCVRPSPRVSDRVPFGTGAAIDKIIARQDSVYNTYNPASFRELKKMNESIEMLFHCKSLSEANNWLQELHPSISGFMIKNNFDSNFTEIRKNCNRPETFNKRFYQWFNGLLVLQYLNESHTACFNKIPVYDAALELLDIEDNKTINTPKNVCKLLKSYRTKQRK